VRVVGVSTVPATVDNSSVLEVIEVVENRSVYLSCRARGSPQPSIIWSRDGVPLLLGDVGGPAAAAGGSGQVRVLSAGRQLEVGHVTAADEATYRCQATNVAGQQEKAFRLRVIGEPTDCVTVRSMVNIAGLTIWSIYCSRGGGEGRADPLIVAPFIGAA